MKVDLPPELVQAGVAFVVAVVGYFLGRMKLKPLIPMPGPTPGPLDPSVPTPAVPSLDNMPILSLLLKLLLGGKQTEAATVAQAFADLNADHPQVQAILPK